MKETRAANRYATSLLDLALEKNSLDKVKSDIVLLKQTYAESREFVLLLESPIVKSDKKIKIFNELFKSKINETTLAFLALIANKRRENILNQICDAFIELYNNHKNIQQVEVTSVNGLDEGLRKKVYDLVKTATKSEVELIEKTNPNLIGGFVLRIGDNQIDSSIVRSLKKFKSNLISN